MKLTKLALFSLALVLAVACAGKGGKGGGGGLGGAGEEKKNNEEQAAKEKEKAKKEKEMAAMQKNLEEAAAINDAKVGDAKAAPPPDNGGVLGNGIATDAFGNVALPGGNFAGNFATGFGNGIGPAGGFLPAGLDFAARMGAGAANALGQAQRVPASQAHGGLPPAPAPNRPVGQ